MWLTLWVILTILVVIVDLVNLYIFKLCKNNGILAQRFSHM